MAALHSQHATRPYHSCYSHTNGPPSYSSSWYTPSRSADDKEDMPWHHMAHTYTCVVENECVRMNKGNRKTEQWILQQQMFVDAENAKYRGQTAQQTVWEETMYLYEMEAEWQMRRGEEARRRAAEKEKKARLIDEEIRKIETRVRVKLEAERRKIAEERRKMQEEQKERDRRAKKAVLEAWRGYEDRWNKLLASTEALDFASVPWPVARAAGKAEEITPQAVVAFLFSPVHSETQTRKERLRSAQLRWHPDRFQRVLKRVKDKDKPDVERAVGVVARCLNDIVP